VPYGKIAPGFLDRRLAKASVPNQFTEPNDRRLVGSSNGDMQVSTPVNGGKGRKTRRKF
jgi:hypothetical protein